MTNAAARSISAAAILLAACGAGFVIDASYPGYLYPDSVDQLEQAVNGHFDDWHSPFMALIWHGLLKLAPGPVGPLLLDCALIWGSLAGLAILMAPKVRWTSLLLLGVPLLPGSFNYLGNIHVDTLLVGWLLGALPCIHLADREDPTTIAGRRAARVAANALLVCGFLTRPNAIFCLIPLLLLANRRLGRRRMVLGSAATLLAMPIVFTLQGQLVRAVRLHPTDAIKTYDLLALSSYEQQNLFPGTWTASQTHGITSSCYTPVQWDPAWSGHCRYIVDGLRQQRLWGSTRLTVAWLHAMLRHPLGTVTMLLPPFRLALFDPNSPSMFYRADNRWGWRVADDPPRPAAALSRAYVDWPPARYLGRPVCFVLLSAASLLLLLRSGAAAGDPGRLALAVLCSGLVYLLSLFPITVSAEYRYFYWCGFATYGGGVLTLFTILDRHRDHAPSLGRRDPGAEASLSVAAAALALVTACALFTLPLTRRIVAISPQVGQPVHVDAVRDANVLFWRRRDFPGRLEVTGWNRDGDGYGADGTGAPLVTEIEGRNQDLEAVLTSPAPARVLITSDGFSRIVETPVGGGRLSVIIPSQAAPPPTIGVSLACTSTLAVAALLWLVLLRRLVRTPRE